MTALRVLEPLEVEVEHIDELAPPLHDCEGDCAPCAREGCGHQTCRHDTGDDCADCDCQAHLADDDCPECNGCGRVSLESVGGSDREYDCYECGGSGTTAPVRKWYR